MIAGQLYGSPHTLNTLNDPWGQFSPTTSVSLFIPDPRGVHARARAAVNTNYVFPCDRVVWLRFRPRALCSKAELVAREAWLDQQNRAARKPVLDLEPPLPVRRAETPWSQRVRGWLRQPVRLRKGSRQS